MFENLLHHDNHARLLHRDIDCSGNDTIYSTWHTETVISLFKSLD